MPIINFELSSDQTYIGVHDMIEIRSGRNFVGNTLLLILANNCRTLHAINGVDEAPINGFQLLRNLVP